MTMPNFLVIGAMKSGTSTLHNYLNQHPQIYMSRLKEPHFFSYNGQRNQTITTLEDYCALFQNVSHEIAIGESSTTYLAMPQITAERIRDYMPNVKLIAILRDPSEAAYSLYLMNRRSELTNHTDKQIIDNFKKIIENQPNSGILGGRYYYRQIKHYLSFFEQKQLKIYLYEDLKREPVGLLQDIFQFLGVDKNFIINSDNSYNTGGIPKNKFIYDLIEKWKNKYNIKNIIPSKMYDVAYNIYLNIRNRNLRKSPQLPLEIRQNLIAIYREDILKLQELLQRDLSSWLQ